MLIFLEKYFQNTVEAEADPYALCPPLLRDNEPYTSSSCSDTYPPNMQATVAYSVTETGEYIVTDGGDYAIQDPEGVL